jgi:hypothetical protein
VIRNRNMVAGFTRYIPMQEVKSKGKKLGAGEWPLEPSPMPIHLYQKGFTLIWGGHGVNGKDGYLKKIGEEHHQIVHSDYGELPFGGAARFGPMRGVSHPCTYNTPTEDYRDIETFDIENRKEGKGNGHVWRIKTNEILVMHADTLHRGRAHVWEEGKWHPSLHCVVESSRYPRKDGGNAVDLVASPETAMRHNDMDDMSDEQVCDAVDRALFGNHSMMGLVDNILTRNRNVPACTLAAAKKLREVFYGENMSTYRKEEGKGEVKKKGGTGGDGSDDNDSSSESANSSTSDSSDSSYRLCDDRKKGTNRKKHGKSG